MQFIFDHLLAILIASVVLLALVANQMRTLDDGISDTSMYLAKNNSLDLAEMIEADLNMTLHRFDASQIPFDWSNMITDADGRTTSFTFYRDSVEESSGQIYRWETRYRLSFVDSLYTPAIDSLGNAYQAVDAMFEVIREEEDCSRLITCSPGVFDFAGNSAPYVKDFRITPLQQDKSPASNVAETHYLQVSFIMSPPLQSGSQIVNKLHWSTLLQVQPY